MFTAIVGILFGNFLIGILFAPSISRLRSTLDKFLEIRLPFESMWAALADGAQRDHDEAQYRKDAEKAVQDFNLFFRQYCIAFKSFQQLGIIFLGGVIVLVISSVWQIDAALQFRLVTLLFSTSGVLLLALCVQRIMAPSPKQMVSIDYLANNIPNLHLENLFDVAELHVDFGRELLSRDEIMHLGLFAKTTFTGYKFLLAVTDSRCSRLYLGIYGSIDSRTPFVHIWRADLAGFRVALGDFAYRRALGEAGQLHMHLWLFIPTPRGWTKQRPDSPRYMSTEMSDPQTGGVRLASDTCHWANIDRNVVFERKGPAELPRWKILNVNIVDPASPAKVVRMFARELETVTSLRVEAYSGLDLRD